METARIVYFYHRILTIKGLSRRDVANAKIMRQIPLRALVDATLLALWWSAVRLLILYLNTHHRGRWSLIGPQLDFWRSVS